MSNSARLRPLAFVIENLRHLGPGQLAERFQLDNHIAETNEIGPVAGWQALPLVINWEFDLTQPRYSPGCQLNQERVMIHCFQQPATQMPVDLHRRTDDGIGLGIPHVGLTRQHRSMVWPPFCKGIFIERLVGT